LYIVKKIKIIKKKKLCGFIIIESDIKKIETKKSFFEFAKYIKLKANIPIANEKKSGVALKLSVQINGCNKIKNIIRERFLNSILLKKLNKPKNKKKIPLIDINLPIIKVGKKGKKYLKNDIIYENPSVFA